MSIASRNRTNSRDKALGRTRPKSHRATKQVVVTKLQPFNVTEFQDISHKYNDLANRRERERKAGNNGIRMAQTRAMLIQRARAS